MISVLPAGRGETSDSRGAIYEQSFNAGEGLRAEIEVQQQTTGEMLKAAFSDGSLSERKDERKREERSAPPSSTTTGSALSHGIAHERDAADGQPNVADHRPGVRAADRFERGHSVVAESSRYSTITRPSGSREHAGYAVRERNSGVQLSTCGAIRDAAAW